MKFIFHLFIVIYIIPEQILCR